MALRRLVQINNASASNSSSPKTPMTPLSTRSTSTSTDSPVSPQVLPSTPRNHRPSIGFLRSPALTPSISSSVPFDWDAARSRKPPPYATPQSKPRKSMGVGSALATPIRKAIVRKKGFFERFTSIPSEIAFQIAMFPDNLPLPAPQTSAWMIGGTMHFLHLCVRWSQVRKIPDSDMGWEDMFHEDEGTSWFDWTTPMTLLLLGASILNAVYLFTRIKLYRLHLRSDPVSSPNAKFVSAQYDFQPLEPPSLVFRLRSALWRGFSASWRFLLGMKPPSYPAPSARTTRVQQLEMWTPNELEVTLFNVYSPVHALLWMATGSSNWMLMMLIMALVGVQLKAMTHSYKTLMKDKEIIATEVMHEYNEQFVYPRVMPVRKDAAVMTNQSELINVWED